MNKNFQSNQSDITLDTIFNNLQDYVKENINKPLVQNSIKQAQQELAIKNLRESKESKK